MLGKVYLISKSTMRYIKTTALLAVILLIVSACGQRGPLYNPKAEPIETSAGETETEAAAKTRSSSTEGSA